MPPTIPQEASSGTPRTAGPEHELERLLTSAAVAPLSTIGWIKITGPDRVRWLNGMVTNSIQDLSAGAGCYNFVLNAQGRIQGDGTVFAAPDHLLLETSRSQVTTLLGVLDRFIIMDDVELTDISPERHGLLLAGPHAPGLLRELDLLSPDTLTPALANLCSEEQPLSVVRAYSPLIPRFELWSADESSLASLFAKLLARGATSCTQDTVDLLRILEGTPLFGTDIRDRDLPQETNATRALHFAKGCYLGQEIVERIRSRGQVHRTFHGFTLDGEPAAPGTILTVEGKPCGELTSTAVFETRTAGDLQLALGYIRREFLVGGRPIHYPGGIAHPAALPFDPARIL